MPPTQSTPWHEELIKLVNETFGIPGSGGYLTGIDLITLPVAFGAGCIVGGGLALYRGSRRWGRCSKGAGVFLCGATLAVPPYIRVMYAPFLFLSPSALLWAGLQWRITLLVGRDGAGAEGGSAGAGAAAAARARPGG